MKVKRILLGCRREIRLWKRALGDSLIRSLPPTPWMSNLKSSILRRRGATIGRNVFIDVDVTVKSPGNLRIGHDVVISKGVLIAAAGSVTIGDRAMIGYDSKIVSADHLIPEDREQSIRFSGHRKAPVVIGKDSWIASNVVVTAGLDIGEGAVVAAGAVVTKSVKPYTIVGGVPAAVIQERPEH